MKLILLSGLDGTGNLFAPFIEVLPKSIETQVIPYPKDERLGYQELIELVNRHLSKEEEYVLLAESFSGYIAYSLALQKPKNLKAVIFVATFLENPRAILSKFLPIVPLQFMLSLPMPSFIAKRFLLGIKSNMVESLQNTLKSVSSSVLTHRLKEIVELPLASEKLDIKAIYIQANNDILVPKRCYEVFKKYVSNIELYKVDGSHLILQGSSFECARIVKKLIST